MYDHLEIIPAQPEDAKAMTTLAMAAKRHWGYPENWMIKWQEMLTISPGCIAKNIVYKAVLDGELLGFYVLFNSEELLELKHLWVHPDVIGNGIGKQLMIHAIQEGAKTDHENLEILSDPNAEGFFIKMGARRVGARIYKMENSQRVLPLLYVNLPWAIKNM
jgi:GNAT superfamily N-acetyltransferase